VRNIRKLWETNEVFREELKELSKQGRAVGPLYAAYKKELAALRAEWKTTISPLESVLRNHKESFMKRAIAISSRKKYILANGRYKNKLFRFAQTYEISHWALFRRIGIKGLPRFREVGRWRSWRESPRYLFRVRL